jgi:hypothetical protein
MGAEQIAFPFDAEFQRKIVRLALEADDFLGLALKWIQPGFFEFDSLRWCWEQIVRERQENRTPTLMVLRDRLRDIDDMKRARYAGVVAQLENEPVREEAFIRQRLAEFVQRNLFVGAFHEAHRLYNAGRFTAAMDLMWIEVDKAKAVTFDAPERSDFFAELPDRQRQRFEDREREWDVTFPTGIHGVDVVLDGGLSLGELGIWIADSKGGKSLFLIHLAIFTVRSIQKNVLFVLLEGDVKQTSNRIETSLLQAYGQIGYGDVKRGIIDHAMLERLHDEYRMLRGKLIIRGMTDAWTHTPGDIRREMADLRAQKGWVPEQMIVDYGDLLRSDIKSRSEEEEQRNVFAALKTLSTMDQGYSIWTASQARRPALTQKEIAAQKKQAEKEGKAWMKPVIHARDIADSYNKVRRADFVGSINADHADRLKGESRLWCDMYRDNAAEKLVVVKQNLSRMIFADLLHVTNRPYSKEAAEVAAKEKAAKEAAETQQAAEEATKKARGKK